MNKNAMIIITCMLRSTLNFRIPSWNLSQRHGLEWRLCKFGKIQAIELFILSASQGSFRSD